jgi:hypothetical protein
LEFCVPAEIEIVGAPLNGRLTRIHLGDGRSYLALRGHTGCATETYPFGQLERVKGEGHSGAEHRRVAQHAIKLKQAILIPFDDEPAKHISKARKRYGRMGWVFKSFRDNEKQVVVAWRFK